MSVRRERWGGQHTRVDAADDLLIVMVLARPALGGLDCAYNLLVADASTAVPTTLAGLSTTPISGLTLQVLLHFDLH